LQTSWIATAWEIGLPLGKERLDHVLKTGLVSEHPFVEFQTIQQRNKIVPVQNCDFSCFKMSYLIDGNITDFKIS
jgi:hypothetical protein